MMNSHGGPYLAAHAHPRSMCAAKRRPNRTIPQSAMTRAHRITYRQRPDPCSEARGCDVPIVPLGPGRTPTGMKNELTLGLPSVHSVCLSLAPHF